MPSPLAHAAVGYALLRAWQNALPVEGRVWRIPLSFVWPVLAVFLSLLPDVDAVVGWLGNSLERYHNNLTHSLLMVFVVPLPFGLLLRRLTGVRLKTGVLLSAACYAVHLLMDLVTYGRGLMLFWPLSQRRFRLPVTLFLGVPWSSPWSSPLYFWMLLNEVLFVSALFIFIAAVRRLRNRQMV